MQHTRRYRDRHITEVLRDRKRCGFSPQKFTKSLHCLRMAKPPQVFRGKHEDSPIHLRLTMIMVRDFVKLLAELPTRMKRRSPFVRRGSVGEKQRKASLAGQFDSVVVEPG
jgi:hypothetical protein